MFEKITKTNVRDYFRAVLPVTFSFCDEDDAPNWFLDMIRYWDNKEHVLSVYAWLGVTFPTWLESFKMPFDWNEDELGVFFEYLGKQYVCNSEIYGNNIHFWYREQARYGFDVYNSLTKPAYADTPWQFVLRNPLLNTLKYVNQIAKAISRKEAHSQYFLSIDKYQKLSDPCLSILANNILNLDKLNSYVLKEYGKFLLRSRAVHLIYNAQTMVFLTSYVTKDAYLPDIQVINEFPESVRIIFLETVDEYKLKDACKIVNVLDSKKKEIFARRMLG